MVSRVSNVLFATRLWMGAESTIGIEPDFDSSSEIEFTHEEKNGIKLIAAIDTIGQNSLLKRDVFSILDICWLFQQR